MNITWAESWEIAGELVDLLNKNNINIPMRLQENMAQLIEARNTQVWSDYFSSWLTFEEEWKGFQIGINKKDNKYAYQVCSHYGNLLLEAWDFYDPNSALLDTRKQIERTL